MGLLNVGALVLGGALIAIGFSRARGPWLRYRQLLDQEANVARYEAWRGGIRDSSPTGASVMMAMFRRQALIGAGIAIVGVVLVVAGFTVR